MTSGLIITGGRENPSNACGTTTNERLNMDHLFAPAYFPALVNVSIDDTQFTCQPAQHGMLEELPGLHSPLPTLLNSIWWYMAWQALTARYIKNIPFYSPFSFFPSASSMLTHTCRKLRAIHHSYPLFFFGCLLDPTFGQALCC